jgi:hypothetical protein
MSAALPSFAHLIAMSDDIGTFEHAKGAKPRREHGYCTDDMARVLVAVTREPEPSTDVVELGRLAFRFIVAAQDTRGAVHNRRTAHGKWLDGHLVDDCWGRSVWALGTATRRFREASVRAQSLVLFERGLEQRSPWPRAMAFAALGAAEVLDVSPGHAGSLALMADTLATIGPLGPSPEWRWPEPRLGYANAVLAEAMIACGVHLARPDVVEDGISLLRWLVQRETIGAHLSPTPVGGAGRTDHAPGFDQQPIEVAAMADACARAARVTGDADWKVGVDMSIRWFTGENDAATVMWDPLTGGGYDGLQPDGPNMNQGTESTLALLTTLQHAPRPIPVG